MDEQRVIWEYIIENAYSSINMPRGSTILSAQPKERVISLYALINPESVIMESRLFEVYNTGDPIGFIPGRKREFLSTCQFEDGNVCHVFERIT